MKMPKSKMCYINRFCQANVLNILYLTVLCWPDTGSQYRQNAQIYLFQLQQSYSKLSLMASASKTASHLLQSHLSRHTQGLQGLGKAKNI